MFRHPIQNLHRPKVGALGDDVTGVYKDIPRSRIVVGLAEQVLQVVELTVDVSNENDPGGLVHGRDVECGGLDVSAEIWLRREWPRSDADEKEVEEETREDGEGGHSADSKAG